MNLEISFSEAVRLGAALSFVSKHIAPGKEIEGDKLHALKMKMVRLLGDEIQRRAAAGEEVVAEDEANDLGRDVVLVSVALTTILANMKRDQS